MTPFNKSPNKVQAAPTSRASNAFIEELLEFERLLFELSVRFANVSAENVVGSIEGALMELVRFLGFDRSAFWEFINEEQQHFLCSVAVEGVEPPQRGPIPVDLAWSIKELRAGRVVVIRSAHRSQWLLVQACGGSPEILPTFKRCRPGWS